jgi:hypothetical protein
MAIHCDLPRFLGLAFELQSQATARFHRIRRRVGWMCFEVKMSRDIAVADKRNRDTARRGPASSVC